MTVFGRLLMTGATVVDMVECGDKMLKQDEVFFGPSPYLVTLEGNSIQWRWNGHDQWKVGNSHGHTIAGIYLTW